MEAFGFFYPEYEVFRDGGRCTVCRVCERQCANGVHTYDPERGVMLADETKCVDCQRCVCLCPARALKIVESGNTFRRDENWTAPAISEVCRQAGSGGVLLSSMGNPGKYPVYWDRMLINASQVTNPPIDPLREPMETRTFLGAKPQRIERDEKGRIKNNLAPQLELEVPVMFSAMSYGSISYNAHAALARAAEELGTYYNTGEGGLHEDFYRYGKNTIVQVASGRFGVHKDYLNAGAAIEIKMGQGAKPGIGGHLPGRKIVGDVSRTRMIPEGSDAISPAPHHDIYSIEDLRQLVYSLKEATGYQKPVIVKIAAVHNVAAIASGVARSGARHRGRRVPGRHRRGARPHPRQRGHPHRARAGRRRPASARGGYPRERVGRRGRLDPVLRRHRQGRRARRRRGLYRDRRAARARLPPLPLLSPGPLQLGHCNPAPRAGAPPRPGGRGAAAGKPCHRLEARD